MERTRRNNEQELSLLTKKLEETLTNRSRPINEAISKIERDNSLLDDYIVPMENITFLPDQGTGKKVQLVFDEDNHFDLHPHATKQIADKLGVPQGYLSNLVYGQEEWQRKLAIQILQTHTNNTRRERVLIRTIENEARGFLSDRYRRLNSMEIFTAFLLAAQSTGSVLVDAHGVEKQKAS